MDECLDCGVCEPECPIDAIVSDNEYNEEDKDKWLLINKKFSNIWPNITKKKEPMQEHEKFRDTICKVVYQPGQFSWTEDGKSDKAYEKEAFKEAMKIAEDVYYAKEDGKIDPTDGATFYHAVYVKPKWRHSMSSSIKVGKHIFYRWDGT